MLEKHHYFVPVVSILDGNSYHENIAYVAEYNPKIIGTMCGSIHSLYEHFNSDYVDLIVLYIDSSFQGCGIGSTFEQWARENWCF